MIFPSSAQWWVPEHYFVEVAAALRRAALNNAVAPAQVDQAFVMLERAVFMLGSTCATLGSWKVSDCGNFVKTHQN